jgi:hypothetical protein
MAIDKDLLDEPKKALSERILNAERSSVQIWFPHPNKNKSACLSHEC